MWKVSRWALVGGIYIYYSLNYMDKLCINIYIYIRGHGGARNCQLGGGRGLELGGRRHLGTGGRRRQGAAPAEDE